MQQIGAERGGDAQGQDPPWQAPAARVAPSANAATTRNRERQATKHPEVGQRLEVEAVGMKPLVDLGGRKAEHGRRQVAEVVGTDPQ